MTSTRSTTGSILDIKGEKMMNTIGSWTEGQRKMLFSLMEKVDFSKEDMENSLKFPMSELSVQEASVLIDCLKNNGDLSEAVGKIKGSHGNAPKGPLDSIPKTDKTSETPAMPKSREEALQRKEKQEEMKQGFTVQPGSELALARTAGIPEEMANLFFMKLNGNAYIKVAGLQYMAGKIGYRRIEITDHYDEKTGTWTAEAKIYPKIDAKMLDVISRLAPDVQKEAYEDLAKPTNGVGTANGDNVQNSNMHKFLREMAQTRALGRALRSYTGYGSTTYEELPQAEIERD
jgi:hypothetical protein